MHVSIFLASLVTLSRILVQNLVLCDSYMYDTYLDVRDHHTKARSKSQTESSENLLPRLVGKLSQSLTLDDSPRHSSVLNDRRKVFMTDVRH